MFFLIVICNFYYSFIYIFEDKEGEEFCGAVSSRNLKLNW